MEVSNWCPRREACEILLHEALRRPIFTFELIFQTGFKCFARSTELVAAPPSSLLWQASWQSAFERDVWNYF